MEIRQATLPDLPLLVPLFDAYRQFYRQPTNIAGAEAFLRARLESNQSVIFLASRGGNAVGFTQLFPSFSSGALARIYILNDLYVAPDYRRQSVASRLIEAAAAHARANGAVRLTLSTELTNKAAQAAYERLGWKRDSVFCVYNFAL